MRGATYSFDIFDTCLIRSCGFSHNVFDLLAIKVLGEKSDWNQRADFVNIRLKAEKQIRNQKEEEITLQEIYNLCDFSGITDVSPEKIAEMEMEIEKKVLVPVYSIKKSIAKLHSLGINIYYISDMYLPQEFIKEILQRYGFLEKGDKIYVSCTSGKTKQDGSLFDLVAQENNINFHNWEHWGDNKHSDYLIPKKKGIKAHLVKHKFSKYEKNILSLHLFQDSLINQRLAGIQKAIRLSEKPSKKTDLAIDVIIPMLVSFVFKILLNAQKEGITHLYFLSRDGALPYHIASLFQEYFPNIELKYFYTSRSALYFPGIQPTSIESLAELFGSMKGKKLFEIFIDKTNIDITPFLAKEKLTQTIDTELQGYTLLKELYNNKSFIKKLNDEHQRQKDLVIKYFIQTEIASQTHKNGLVDIRGTRKCHQIINQILINNNFPQIKGYYWEVTENRRQIKDAGEYFAEFHSERFQFNTQEFKYIENLYSVIEQYICATGTSRTIAYKEENGNILPIFEPNSESDIKKELFYLHKKVADLYIYHYKENRLFLHNSEISYLTQYNLIKFAHLPYKSDLIALTNITTNDSRFDYSYLIKKYSFADLLKRRFNMNEWIRGSICYSIYYWTGEKIGRAIVNKILKK